MCRKGVSYPVALQREKSKGVSGDPEALRNWSLACGPTTYLARICWNSKGWRCATGEARGLELQPSFVSTNGFGHEEWLFNNLWEIDGWRYGFLQPVNRAWDSHQGEVIDVGLYTKDPAKRRLWVGRIRRAEVLTEQQARTAHAEFERRGLLRKMRDEVTAIGGDTSTLESVSHSFAPFNIRFLASDLEIADPPEALPADHRVWSLHRYVLTSAGEGDFGLGGSAGTRNRRPEHFDPRSPTGPTEVEARHNQLQNHLFDLLDQKYGCAVVMERNRVDIVVEHPDLHAFIEVKSDPEARLALRHAIGQLLEYAWYERPDSPRPELIVAAPAPLTPAARAYIDRIRDKEGLRIRYFQVTLETSDLAGLTS
ncbi:hypothetical protein A2cp1_3694 [Anaeromyxobacter dehalogenans 2CP-1]|uniref:Uncharacterized protein n=1 Tax=Anaeromyxobacter dehalogenans (strain ATCC BAA-258 / DSM 21875 / 2CP-1) TaxID=455488 RepID=B8J6P8_ANAD2|nr:hypothetical protein [Anaeromyxobacter dehalogenans]ACL67020.1 hypothetical protein A2cp1_3694 [Anaeromyxobacter dehalogenans 2CP-1]